jgi:hypothetical protein
VVDIVQVAAIAIAAGMRVDDLAEIPLASLRRNPGARGGPARHTGSI